VTNRDSAILGYRVLAIWLLATAIIGAANVPYFFDSQFEHVRGLSIAFVLLPSVVGFVIGGLVWLESESLAAGSFPRLGEPNAHHGLQAEQLFALALSVIGVLLVVEAIPAVVNGLTLWGISRQSWNTILGPERYSDDQRSLIWGAAAKANTVAAAVRLLIGLGLILGPKKLAAGVARIRREFRGSLVEDGSAEAKVEVPPSRPGA
jgi:hypothetical protein